MDTFTIASDNGPLLYHLFYQISFLVGLVFFLFEGYKRKFPFSTLMLIVALAGFFLIAGTKLGTYRLEDWQYLFANGEFPYTASKTIVTGLFSAMLGLFLGKVLLRFKPSLLDVAALVVPSAMILQRIGCLFAGCCYGLPTNLPWGIRYASNYRIYEHQIAEGIAGCSANFTSAVHPVQAYEIIGYLIIIAVLLGFRRRIRVPNSYGLLSLSMVFGLRFIVEFFRDSATDSGWGAVWVGLKTVQWVALAVVLMALGWVYWNEKKARSTEMPESAEVEKPSIIRESLLAAFLVVLLWQTHGWFTALETFVFQFLTSAALLSLVVKVFRKSTTPIYRWSLVAVAGVSFLLMSQTVDKKYISPASKEKSNVINQFKISHLRATELANYNEKVYYDMAGDSAWVDAHYETDCDGNQYWVPAQYSVQNIPMVGNNDFDIKKFRSQGAEWKRSILNDHGGANTSAIGAFHYVYQNYRNGQAITEGTNSYGMYFWFGSEQKDFALKAGLMGGKMYRFGSFDNKGPFSTGTTLSNQDYAGFTNVTGYSTPKDDKFWALPIVYARIGNQNRFCLEAGAFDNLQYNIAFSRYRAGLGIGNELLGIKYKFSVAGGVTDYAQDKLAYYIDSEFDLGKKAFVNPTVFFGEKPIFGLGLGYKW